MENPGAFVVHLEERHLIVMPDVVRDMPDKQLETVIVALHADLHERQGWSSRRPAGRA